MKAQVPKLVDVTICDDVRQENTGQLLVVGMYLGRIEVSSFPMTIPSLCFLCKWRTEGRNLPGGEFRLGDPAGQVLNSLQVPPFVTDDGSKLSVTVYQFPQFTFTLAGTYQLAFRPQGGRSRVLHSFDVSQRPDPA